MTYFPLILKYMNIPMNPPMNPLIRPLIPLFTPFMIVSGGKGIRKYDMRKLMINPMTAPNIADLNNSLLRDSVILKTPLEINRSAILRDI